MADAHAHQLGNQFRLDKIRSIKQSAFFLQWIVFLLLAVVIVFLDGLSFDPIYIPLGGAVYYLCVIILVMIGEGIAFTLLEMRYEVSDSERYLKARGASNRAILRTIVAVLVAILTITPPIIGMIEDASTMDGTMSDQADVTIPTVGVIGLRKLDSVRVSVNEGSAQVFIVEAAKYAQVGMDYDSLRLSSLSTQYNITSGSSIVLDDLDLPREDIVIVVYSVSGGIVSYKCEYILLSSFTIMLPIFTLAIAIANIAWFIVLVPMRKKYRELSIYA